MHSAVLVLHDLHSTIREKEAVRWSRVLVLFGTAIRSSSGNL